MDTYSRTRRRHRSGNGSTQPKPSLDDPLWYKDAVIYQVHVKAFFDSNDDGIGDFRGLTEKLDYIQRPRRQHDLAAAVLSVAAARTTATTSPTTTTSIRDYGTRDDFRHFVREAHRRGLRVITELVINHTSDQHPWFQAARRAPPGSPKRNYYVWSDDPTRSTPARASSSPTPRSPTGPGTRSRSSYYWHRFFSHQPDLNFDNPHVLRAVIRIMRFWLDMGVDGFRLDAIPYLCEREGTNNENLPETHAVHQADPRASSTRTTQDRLLLAEANQWPEDVRDYFGDGDECHMAYHFPLMPRMYMAIAQEDRHPIVEIMAQTPDIPDNCQWAIFLRNHDELTLEMVTEPGARLHVPDVRGRPARASNLGIRRRLAPLMENDRPQDQADEQPAAVDARLADHLLRRRDRHGRQHLPRRPQRRAHADAVEPGPQRRLLARRSAAPVPAADHGPGLRLRGGQRRGAERAARRRCCNWMRRMLAVRKRAPGVRPRHAALPSGRATARSSPTCASTRTRSSCASPTSRARRSRSSSICARSRDACRSSCSAARRSRRSASCPTC